MTVKIENSDVACQGSFVQDAQGAVLRHTRSVCGTKGSQQQGELLW